MADISVPSYVIPGTYFENIEFLRDKELIQGIELLFFSFDEDSRRLLMKEREGIAAARDRFSFSVHMPDVLDDGCEVLVELLVGIADRFIVHAPSEGLEDFAARLRRWITRFGNVFAVENVAGRAFEPVVRELSDVPLCIDTGHFLLDGVRPATVLRRWFSRVSEIHLHGTADGRDHVPFSENDDWFVECMPLLCSFNGTIHLELFDYGAVAPMIDLVAGLDCLQTERNECEEE